jgi:uncharacterized protein YjaZ
MLTVINHLENKDAEAQSIELIQAAYSEVRELLPELPESLQIYFDNWYLIPETGDGGFAYAPGILTMSFDPDFADKKAQAAHVRSTVFHESYHLVQGHTYEDVKLPYRHALDSAIYEGCASVFEREHTHPDTLPGDYSMCAEQQLQEWADALAAISNEDYRNGDTGLWMKWALYDKEANERWRVYKVGTWIVDRALANTGLDILDFRTKSAKEILALASK